MVPKQCARSLVLLSLLAGCRVAPPESKQEGVVVTVSPPLRQTVTDYEYVNGRIEAPESVEVRARVSGYLAGVYFKEGDEVYKGQKLFEIDRRPYQALADQAAANVESAKATAKANAYELTRQKDLVMRSATSKADYDNAVGTAGQSAATVRSNEAALEQAKLNLGYTIISSEIDGRISKYNITPGNLVVADQTLLTTVVSYNPMYAYFDMDELTVIRIKELIRAGKTRSANDTLLRLPELGASVAGLACSISGKGPCYVVSTMLIGRQGLINVDMGLAADADFPYAGIVTFVDNTLNPNTGTLRVRGTFTNTLKNGQRLLSPGMYCRVRLVIGQPHQALLVSDRAVGTEQGQKYVFVVDDKNQVQYRPVQTGQLVRGLRVVNSGLQDGERIIVTGLQRVRPGMTVEPKPADMVVELDRKR